MADKLTPEQIVIRIEAALPPHKVKAKIHDYGAKITVKVWSAKDGSHLFTLQDSSVDELQVEHYLKDVIGHMRCEVEDRTRARSL